MTLFVSSTEPAAFRALGSSSQLPEEYGVDFLWPSVLGLVGVQRKEFPSDFLASVHGDRLYREFIQMKELSLAVLMLEGRALWTTEGMLVRERSDKRNGWTRRQHRNYLHSVQMRGIHITQTDTVSDSINYIRDLQVWTDKNDHHALDVRPGPKGSGWNRVTNVDYQRHLLQSLPGIGPKQANLILQHLGMPLGIRVGVEELMTVPGIGRKKAESIVRVFARDGAAVSV